MAFGPCLCGDLQCPSCGPAQGNYKCWHCGEWSADGGCKDPDACNAAADRAEQDYHDKMAEEHYDALPVGECDPDSVPF